LVIKRDKAVTEPSPMAKAQEEDKSRESAPSRPRREADEGGETEAADAETPAAPQEESA